MTTSLINSRSSQHADAAYLHVPFCVHRCGYCDFTLISGRDELIDVYLEALEIELSSLQSPRPMQTLFLGGGTPSHLSLSQLSRLFDLLDHWLPTTSESEFSLEANPLDLSWEKLDLFAARGVNRISLGVQTFNDDLLKVLERDHSGTQALEAIQRTRSFVDNLSIDLIFGVPGQSLDLWQQTLDLAIAAQPLHISTYGLTIEKGTSFWIRREKGMLSPLTPELEREMYGRVMDCLSAAKFEQYELSNFARPGFACRHNIGYWTGRSFYGFGPGAAQYLDGCRELNHRSVTHWLKRVQSGRSPISERESLNDEDRARELAVLNLRQIAGIDCCEFEERTGFDVHLLAGETITRFLRRGWLEATDSHVRLTREGRFVADTIVAEFL
ncbi:MAG: radical SAM family heme chaperone HemW [Planctomycetota bacterium]|nr:radical SAM family heme chaperone HemW [Planctomycetota bacterium]MDA1212820.1 radical SAM family heme chaperone HemW [Planctomycetota bacterium]